MRGADVAAGDHATATTVPTARRGLIFSFKTNLASSVSKIKLAADAGTAKLNGSVCTRAMNEKNDTAMHPIASSR